MTESKCTGRSGVFAVIAGICLVSLLFAPAAGLTVEGVKIMMDVSPGSTYTFPMAVSIGSNEPSADYAIDVVEFAQTSVGGAYTVGDSGTVSTYSAKSFVTVSAPEIHLEPGERKELTALINVPSGAGAGGKYALIYIHPKQGATGQAAMTTSIVVPVMLTISGTQVAETGQITNLEVQNEGTGKPVVVVTTLKNTGNHHYYAVVNKIVITDDKGNVVAEVQSDPFSRAVIPSQSVEFEQEILNALQPGSYSVESELSVGNTLLDKKTTAFTVNEAYVPPFEAASVSVSPNSAAVLSTSKGEIRIDFPKGAFLYDGEITVTPYTDKLPAAPKDAEFTGTVFNVDGVMGLLSKDATIVVKYTSADLRAAGGDPKKLAFARWDRSDNTWTIVPATIDTGGMTMTAQTNRFSLWAVVVVNGSSQPGPTQQAPLDALCCATGLLAVIAVRRFIGR